MNSQRWSLAAAVMALFVALSCGGGSYHSSSTSPTSPTPGAPVTNTSNDSICNCTPSGPDSTDYRHAAKHVGLSGSSGAEINVATMMSWGTPPDPPADAPRSGRELQMFHITRAYMHFVWLVGSDCDIHVEIADSPDPNAPRAIVETPIDSVFCPARSNLRQALSGRGVPINMNGYDLPTPVPVEVLGLAFQDYNHPRGTTHVATVWEIHPAIITVLPQ
jgi:hypothetical protein